VLNINHLGGDISGSGMDLATDLLSDPAISQAVGNNPATAAQTAADMTGLIIGKKDSGIQVTLSDADIQNMPPEVKNHLTLEDCVLYHPCFHPASTELPNTHNATFHDAEFRELGKDQVVTLDNGRYEGVRFTDIKDGTIVVDARVDGLDISGVRAELHMSGNSVVNGMSVDKRTDILKLEAAPGATIMHANLGDATISMASSLRETVWQNVQFNGTGLRDVDMTGATLAAVTFENADVQDLNLSGAKLTNVIINGELISDPAQLQALGITTDDNIHITVTHGYAQEREQALEEHTEKQAAQLTAQVDLGSPIIELNNAANSVGAIEGDFLSPKQAEYIPAKELKGSADPAENPLAAAFSQVSGIASGLAGGLQVADISGITAAHASGAGSQVAEMESTNKGAGLDKSYFASMSKNA
jgi:uncharacterized protein YjbI with pentapeptide repeats